MTQGVNLQMIGVMLAATLTLLCVACMAVMLIVRGIDKLAALLTVHWQHQRIGELRTAHAQEQALAEILANASGALIQVSSGSLRCIIVPTPYLAATCVDGARVYVTQQPDRLHRLGFARRVANEMNLTRRGTLRRAELHALWSAAHAAAGLPHASIRADRDWHAVLTEQTTPNDAR